MTPYPEMEEEETNSNRAERWLLLRPCFSFRRFLWAVIIVHFSVTLNQIGPLCCSATWFLLSEVLFFCRNIPREDRDGLWDEEVLEGVREKVN